MTEIDLSRAEWRKSSFSSQSGNCVEVARNLPGLVAVRDTKHQTGPSWWSRKRHGESSSGAYVPSGPVTAGQALGRSVRHTDWDELKVPVRLAIEARTIRCAP